MKTLTPDTFMQTITSGQIEPLYLFSGLIPSGKKSSYVNDEPEEYLQRQAIRALVEQAVDPATSAFNLSTLSAAEATLAEIVDTAQQLPAFARRRLVLVYDLDKAFKSGGAESGETKSTADAPGVEALIEYVKRPSETTTVVFVYNKPDRRLNVTTALMKACTVVQFVAFNEVEANAWVKKYLRQRECSMDEASLGLLIGRVGTNLTHLASELDKLTTYVRRGPISRVEIEALVPRLKEHSNFELSDHILARDRAGALKLLKRQLGDGEEPVMVLGVIARLYRQMALAKDLMAQGAPATEVAKSIGMSPYGAGKFNEQVRRIPMDDVLQGVQRIAAVDRAIKSSLGTPELQLEVLVYELCTPRDLRLGSDPV